MRNPKYVSRKTKIKQFLSSILFGAVIGAALFIAVTFFVSPEASSQKNFVQFHPLSTYAAPTSDTPVPAVEIKTSEFTVGRNDTFYDILKGEKVPPEEILRVVSSARGVYDLRRLKKGDLVKVSTVGDRLDTIEYRFSDLEGVIVTRDDEARGGFTARRYNVPYEIRHKLVSAVIDNSMYEAGVKAGANPQVIVLLSDIFAWDVDFATDMRKGDSFRVLYETINVDGRPLKTGRVLAAEVTNGGKKFTALYYEGKDGSGDYYDPNGKSLSRTLLKSPLRYRRISSHFTRKRYHPILKKYTPHHGIDYAAPVGTPVESAGDGKVVYAGWKRGYGYYVRIRHNSTYTTAYGHFSRIKKGIRKGKRVRQGDVIGYVGSTGLSTGPHLHYEVKVRGRLVNPLKIKSSSRRSISKEEMPGFTALRDRRIYELRGSRTLVAAGPEVKGKTN